MIPVLSPEQIRKLDQLTVERQHITFDALMERAGSKATEWILQKFPEQKIFSVYYGFGNNGGDGLVIARLLADHSKNVTVYLIEGAGKETEAFKANMQRLTEQVKAQVISISTIEQIEIPAEESLIIEAIFGNGINREPENLPLEVIQKINTFTNTVVSIDVPGGLLPESVTSANKCIHADYTLCFQVPRLPFFFPETGNLCGEWELLDIDLDKSGLSELSDKLFISEKTDLQHWIKPRNKFSYKNNFGHALLLAGSSGKCGAAILSAKACLKSGAGLVTVRAAQCCIQSLQSAVPEAMVLADESASALEVPVFPLDYSVIAAGPGLGTANETGNVIKRLLQDYKGQLVLDADAVNLLAENKTWLAFLPPGSIFTPHMGEFRRLAGDYKDPFERMNAQREFSRKYHCYLILKGRYTFIACPDGTVIINTTGNAGMATAGTGDVLTGIITGLCAQELSPMAAAVSGVYIHGLAGDLCKEIQGEQGIIAGDIIDQVPRAITSILPA
jgi:hydroxyethylthiazole kinase-like uncharacterized protein yjeF